MTAAIFAPYPNVIVENSKSNPASGSKDESSTAGVGVALASASSGSESKESTKQFEVIVAADWQGGVKFYINR